jgi:hypothetical protein
MKEPTKRSAADTGQVELEGSCQVCGTEGRVIAVPGAPAPNEFCARCAIEYGESAVGEEGVEDELQ